MVSCIVRWSVGVRVDSLRDLDIRETVTVGKRRPAAEMNKEIEGDNSRRLVTHPPSQEVLLMHQRELDGEW